MIGYETIFIIHPELDEENLTELINKYKALIKKAKGKLIHEYVWGRRKLAYPISNQNFGVYHVWYLTGNGEMLDELHKQFRFSDNLIRFQSVIVDDLDEEARLFSEMLKLQNEEAAARAAKVIKTKYTDKLDGAHDVIKEKIKPTSENDVKESINKEASKTLDAENSETSTESIETSVSEKENAETDDSKQ